MSIDLIPRFLGALFLALSTGYISYTLGSHLLGRSTVALRWSASAVMGMWMTSLLFHILLPFGQFRLPVVLGAVGIMAVLVRILGNPLELFLRRLVKDLTWWGLLWRRGQQGPYRWLIYGFGLFLLLKTTRVLLLPPLGWDTLTYHAVKAGLWVQGGGPITLNAPGGWSFYRHYFGGGEIFTAWAMLPFHGDLLVSTVDTLQWLLLGLVLYALGRQLRLPVRYAWLGVFYILSLPALHLLIGSGYVEPGFHLTLLASLLFFVLFLRRPEGGTLLLSMMAIGLAVGIKVTAIPTALLLLLGTLLVLVRNRSTDLGWGMVGGCLAAVTVTFPWMLYNIHETGYPLGPIPLRLAGFPLGQSNSSLDWYQQILTLVPYRFDTELQALKWLFRSPTDVSLHLSLLTVGPILISLPLLVAWIRRERWVGLALVGFMGSIVAYFYSPGFSVVRLMFAGFNGRFLVPLVAVLLLVSLGYCRRKTLGSTVYFLFLWAGIVVHILSSGFYGWAPFEKIGVPLTAVSLLFIVYLLSHFSLSGRGLPAGLLLITILLGPLLGFYKDSVRYQAAAQSSVSHPTVTYWAGPAAMVDQPPRRNRIAVTAGPRQAADNWAMYLFLGRKLQNTIHYVPISRDGNLLDFWPRDARHKGASFSFWMERLRGLQITHVMSFHPGSLEMDWMELRSDLFRRLDGMPGVWGFYQVNR